MLQYGIFEVSLHGKPRDGIKAPVNEDSELGILEPVRKRMAAKRLCRGLIALG